MKYSEIIQTKEYKQDWNCCTVVASSVIFNKPFGEMQKFYDQHGRKRKQGYSGWREAIIDLCKKYNYTYKAYAVQYNYKNGYEVRQTKGNGSYIENNAEVLCKLKTKNSLNISNFNQYLPKGNYIMGFNGSICHVGAVKNGIVEDWTDGRRYAICSLFKIEKNENVKCLTKSLLKDFESFGF